MGRRATRKTVQVGLSLSVYDLIQGATWPGRDGGGSIDWTVQPSGQKAGGIAFKVRMSNPTTAHVRLIYLANEEAIDHRIALSRTACHFGGWRWWFVCPLSGRRVGKLHLPSGALRFASREACHLTYQSCRNTALQQSRNLQRRLCGRFRTPYSPDEGEPPPRPKGMHAITYERLTLALAMANMRHGDMAIAEGERFLRRSCGGPRTLR